MIKKKITEIKQNFDSEIIWVVSCQLNLCFWFIDCILGCKESKYKFNTNFLRFWNFSMKEKWTNKLRHHRKKSLKYRRKKKKFFVFALHFRPLFEIPIVAHSLKFNSKHSHKYLYSIVLFFFVRKTRSRHTSEESRNQKKKKNVFFLSLFFW